MIVIHELSFRVKIMVGMGSELVEPGLTPDQELNGEMVYK